jgi:hypothetical protein
LRSDALPLSAESGHPFPSIKPTVLRLRRGAPGFRASLR